MKYIYCVSCFTIALISFISFVILCFHEHNILNICGSILLLASAYKNFQDGLWKLK